MKKELDERITEKIANMKRNEIVLKEVIKEKNDSNSFRTFVALNGWLFFLPIFSVIIYLAVLLFIAINTLTWGIIHVTIVFFGSLLMNFVFISYKYVEQLNWQKKLNFELIGWDELIEEHSIKDSEMYRDITITIIPKVMNQNHEMGVKVIEYLVLRFNVGKDRNSLNDKMFMWEQDGLNATGLANNDAFKKVKEWLRTTANALLTEEDSVEAIKIEFSPEEHRYTGLSDSMS